MRVCVRRWVGVPLVVGLLGVAGCAAPATRYPADLKPCDLLSQQAAEELLGVGTLDPPEAKDGWLGEYTVNEYCTWSWERPEDWQAGAGVGPSERTLTIDLSVYDADSDGADGAAKSMADRHHDGQRPVREIGEEAIWWPARHSWAASYLAFRRDNAVVVVSLTGYDCCTTGALGRDITESELRDVVTRAATEIDKKLKTKR